MKTHAETIADTTLIEVNQRWVAYDNEGHVFRRLRILAPHPDGGFIYIDEPSKSNRGFQLYLGVCPEYNLKRVYELEESND